VLESKPTLVFLFGGRLVGNAAHTSNQLARLTIPALASAPWIGVAADYDWLINMLMMIHPLGLGRFRRIDRFEIVTFHVRRRTDRGQSPGHPWYIRGRRRAIAFSLADGRIHEEKRMNKDQVDGALKKAKGKVKEVAGKVVGNKKLKRKGKIEKGVGELQSGYGDLKEDHKSD